MIQTENPLLLLRVRERPDPQRVRIFSDRPILRVHRKQQPVCHWVRSRQLLLRCLPVSLLLQSVLSSKPRQARTNASFNRADHPCGAKDPTPVNSSTISSTMSKTATGSGSGSAATSSDTFATLGSSQTTAAGGDGSNANGDSGASQLALDMGKNWGLAVVLGGVFAGVALVL